MALYSAFWAAALGLARVTATCTAVPGAVGVEASPASPGRTSVVSTSVAVATADEPAIAWVDGCAEGVGPRAPPMIVITEAAAVAVPRRRPGNEGSAGLTLVSVWRPAAVPCVDVRGRCAQRASHPYNVATSPELARPGQAHRSPRLPPWAPPATFRRRGREARTWTAPGSTRSRPAVSLHHPATMAAGARVPSVPGR